MSYTKSHIKSFESYAEKIEKLSYVRCKESLIDFITNRSIVRTTIIDKARDPYEKVKRKETSKLVRIEREVEEVKPPVMYAKTGEIRLRDLSPTVLKDKSKRMKRYAKWYLKPEQFSISSS